LQYLIEASMNYLLLAFSLLATSASYGATTTSFAAEYDMKHSIADRGIPLSMAAQTTTAPVDHLSTSEPLSPIAYLDKLNDLQQWATPAQMVREFYALLREANSYEASTNKNAQTLSDYAYKIVDHFAEIRTSILNELEKRTDFASRQERIMNYQQFRATSQSLNIKLITATLTLPMINLVSQAAEYRTVMAHKAGMLDAARSYEYLHDTLVAHEKEKLKQHHQPL
jgi:hypothetical protein